MLVLKAHQHQPRHSCHVPIQNTCCIEIGLIALTRRCWRWTWWWLGQLRREMLWERTSKNPPLGRREAWWYPGSAAADGKSPAVVKQVRISPTVYILLTLGQILRDTKFLIIWHIIWIRLLTFFNSLQHSSIAHRCIQILVATDELTLKTMEILLGAEGKWGPHTSFLPS